MIDIEPPEGLFEEEHLLDEPEQPEPCVSDVDDLEEEYGDYDDCVNAQITIPRHGMPAKATVKVHRLGGDGTPIGRDNPNPILNTA